MNSIQLTEEHKIKLAEMCRALFPEYINLEFNNNNLCFLTQETFDIALEFETFGVNKDYNFKVSDLYLEEYDIEIHWFEFVFINLVSKIQNSLPEELIWRDQPEYVKNVFSWEKGNKWTMYSEFHFKYPKNIYTEHPIDYLYTEFQKIK